MKNLKLEYVKFDLERHFNQSFNSTYQKARSKEPKMKEGLFFEVFQHLLPSETIRIPPELLEKYMKRTGELEAIAFELDIDIKTAIRTLYTEPYYYEDYIFSLLAELAHAVYPSYVFGGDIVGCLALTYFGPQQIRNKELFGRKYKKLEIDAYAFFNLPMNANVWRFIARTDEPYKRVGFCFSVERKGNHQFVRMNELQELTKSLIEISKKWLEDVEIFESVREQQGQFLQS